MGGEWEAGRVRRPRSANLKPTVATGRENGAKLRSFVGAGPSFPPRAESPRRPSQGAEAFSRQGRGAPGGTPPQLI